MVARMTERPACGRLFPMAFSRMTRLERWRTVATISLAVFYGAAGILHILLPAPFLTIVPTWVPEAATVIWLTGVCEVLGALGLFIPAVRRYAGLALALYAVCVFPANIKHALDSLGNIDTSVWQWSYHLPRLALQPVIVWWALFAGGAVSWPFARAR